MTEVTASSSQGPFEINRVVRQATSGQNEVLIPGLPDEIAFHCIARVPRSYHHTIRNVCQGWRSLLQGRVFWELRQELSLTEEWLYLYTPTNNVWRCFDPSTQAWSKLPPMPNDNWISAGIGSLDGKLFVVGGHPPGSSNPYDTLSCKTVTYFDARSYCWKKAADLNIAQTDCLVGIINNQLYAFAGWTQGYGELTPTVEVYDPVTDTWKFVSSLESPTLIYNGVTMGEKFYATGRELEADDDEFMGFVYDSRTDKWENMADGLRGGWQAQTTILNGKFYTAGDDYVAEHLEDGYIPGIDEVIQAYNPSKDIWEIVQEVWWEGPGVSTMNMMTLVSFCGKLCMVSVADHDDLEEDEFSMIRMVMLEVKESTEGPSTCTATFRDEFYEPFEEGVGPYTANLNVEIIAL